MGSAAATRLCRPVPAAVHVGEGGAPARIGSELVEAVLEDWLVEDRWWTGRPLRRRYFECVLEGGRNVVVFHDLARRRWFEQRA